MNYTPKRVLALVVCISILLLSACSGTEQGTQNMRTEGNVHLTDEVPDAAYILTARNCTKYSVEEQKVRAEELAQILGVEVDLASYEEFDGDLQFTTQDGGIIETSASAHYWAFGSFAAEAELENRAQQVARFSVADGSGLDQTYPLNGTDYSIGAAVDYVSSFWAEHLFQFSLQPDASVERVIVYQWEDGHYSYVLLMSHEYDGIPLEQYSTFSQMNSRSNGFGGFRKSYILVEMDAPDHIATYSDHYPTEIVSAELIEQPLMTEDEALQRVQEVMATYSSVNVQESQLCYAAYRYRSDDVSDEEWNSSTYQYRPYWCFVLEWATDGDGNYTGSGWDNLTPNVTLYVDAVDGTAYLLDSINMTELQISQ